MARSKPTPEPTVNPAKIRVGLGMIVVTVSVALAILAAVDEPLPQAIAVGLIIVAGLRLVGLRRWARQQQR